MSADEDITEKMLSDGIKLTGLDLAMLGYEAHPDDLSEDERAQFEVEDLEEMAAAPPEAGSPPTEGPPPGRAALALVRGHDRPAVR